jgi:hypothetical protein
MLGERKIAGGVVLDGEAEGTKKVVANDRVALPLHHGGLKLSRIWAAMGEYVAKGYSAAPLPRP